MKAKVTVHLTHGNLQTGTSNEIELDENGSGVWFYYNFDSYGAPQYSEFIPMHRVVKISYDYKEGKNDG